jgi:hypothetical protein
MLVVKVRRPSRKGAAAVLRKRHGGGVKPTRRRVRQALSDIERGLEDTERRGAPSNIPTGRR